MQTANNKPIVNKVKKAGLVTIDLQEFYDDTPVVPFDLKDYLYMELVLKEKEFRQALDEHEWSRYEGKVLAVFCSTDAIIAHWAWMLVASYAQGIARDVLFGGEEEVRLELFRRNLEQHDWSQYEGRRVLLKGCSEQELSPAAYMMATRKLLPIVDRLMYGEACSFVPVYNSAKQKKQQTQNQNA